MPRDPGAILKFVQDVSLQQNTLVIDAAVVVHSSEGIGRTGTFIAVDILLNLITFQGESGICWYICLHILQNMLSLAYYFAYIIYVAY